MKTKLFTLLIALVTSINVFSYDVEVDGLYYNLNKTAKTAAVTYKSSVYQEHYRSYDTYNYENSRFNDNWSITSAIIPETIVVGDVTYQVTSIENNAFDRCYELTSVTIGNSVTIIGNYAFIDCSSLTSITIGNNVTTFGSRVFRGCYMLTSVIWNAKNCKNFSSDDTPFYYHNYWGGDFDLRTHIISFTFGDNVKHVPQCLCNGMSMTTIEIPNSVTSIGENAFDNCISLISATIGNSVTSIGKYAFRNCSSLTSVVIPNSVTSIGEEAFGNCSSLTSATIGNSVTSIGKYAFRNCSSLKSVVIPNSVTSIGSSAFSGCKIEKIYFSGTMEEWCAKLFSPGSISSSYTLYINGEAVTNAVIPNSITSIQEKAFYNCSSLTSATIGNSVTGIGKYAFHNCSSLTATTIGNSVTSIGDFAFSGCSKLTSVIWNAKKCNDFSQSNTPFYYYNGSSTNNNFDLRAQITSFTFGDNVESIPAYLCSGMSNLTSVTIPNSVKSIGSFAFNDCSKITSDLNLSSVTSIGECAFRNCSSLTSIGNLSSVTSIGDNAFYNCSNITSDLNLISVETIGQQAFYGCSSLTKVVIGDGATSIEQQAFANCTYLEDITIGSGINVDNGIGQNAFNGCRYLLSVTCKAIYPPVINANVFQDCGVLGGIDLYVPEESVKRYKKADVWSEFNIVGVNIVQCNDTKTTDGITVWEDQLPYTWEGISFTTAGTETKTLQASDGCDSIVTFTLRVRYPDIVLQENESSEYYDLFAEDYNGYTVTTATLNRQFTQGKWATLCLPFNVSKGMMMALGLNARVYEFRYAETVDNLTVIYFAVAQSIEAGKGYIVNANAKLAKKESFVFQNVTITTDADNADITALTGYNDNSGRGSIYLVGTLRTGKLQGTTNGNIYLGLKDNMLYYPNTVTGTNIRAYRGFFRSEVPLNAQRIRIVAEGVDNEELIIDNGQLIIENSSAVKYIENGILYIRSNGKTYNAQGQRLD